MYKFGKVLEISSWTFYIKWRRIWVNFPRFLWKNYIFFYLSLPKVWLSHLQEIIFLKWEIMSYTLEKFHNVISKICEFSSNLNYLYFRSKLQRLSRQNMRPLRNYYGNQVNTMSTTLTILRRSKMSLIPYKISRSWWQRFWVSRGMADLPPPPLLKVWVQPVFSYHNVCPEVKY